MEVRCKPLYKRFGGRYGQWTYKTYVMQLADFPNIYLEVYSDMDKGNSFRGYAPITFDRIPLEFDILDSNNVHHTIKHDGKGIMKVEADNFGTLYRLPLSDDDRRLSDSEKKVSDEEFTRIVGLLHPVEVDYCENRKEKTN